MAKANVLVRRIRAYERRIKELTSGAPWREGRDRGSDDAERYSALLVETEGELDAFLAGRTAGPWMKYANAAEACAA